MSHGETVLVTLGLDSVDLDGLHRCKMDKEDYTKWWGGDGKRWPAPIDDLLYSCYKRRKNGASSAPMIECVLVWTPSPDQSPGADRSSLTRRPEAELRINRRMGWAWGWVGELPFCC